MKNLNITPEEWEEIERYLLEQLSVEEQQAFDQRLATDALLQNKLRQAQLLMTGIKEAALQNSLPHFHASLPITETEKGKPRKLVMMKRWLAAASVLLVLATGGWWLVVRKSPAEQLYAEYFLPDPGLITAMSSSDNYVFDKAMVDYKTGNYEMAVTAWKGLQQQNPNSDTLNYFVGTALLASGNSGDALPYLKKVTEANKSYFQKEAYWYTGMALIEQNRLGEAAEFIRLSDRPEKEALLQRLK